ncbi:MAG: Na/Pi cotransporter family protein [Caldisericia bacterium]|nr:Na/Pi cotransporter family protein [Caldisericia bacterium]MDD4614040.1 Na/Pi cotransporter family protein [Caldisericia bacterium]
MGPLGANDIGFIIGGLGVFLYGLFTFSEYLKDVAGDRLKSILNSATQSPWIGLLTGALLASLVQSSSVVTVITLAFVNSGLLTFEQSLGLIFGANIGTTITAQIIAFNIAQWGFYIIPLGLLVVFIAKRRRPKAVGNSIVSFGFLLMGLSLMTSGLKPLRQYEPFVQLMASFGDSPIQGILAATLFTGIVQSSSATTSLVVTMAKEQLLSIKSAIPLVLGANIGTTITAALASIGANKNAKRVAMAHFIFNLSGVIVVYPFIVNGWYSDLVVHVTSYTTGGHYTLQRLIANSHTVFNVVWSVFWCWQVTLFARFVKFLIPGEMTKLALKSYLDKRLISTPSLALEACREELSRMAGLAHDMVEGQMAVILKKKPFKDAKEVWEIEKIVNQINRDTIVYLKDLYNSNLTEEESKIALNYMHVSSDLERWGDHATNLYEVAEHVFENNTNLSDDNLNQLGDLFHVVKDNMKIASTLLSSSRDHFQISEMDAMYIKARKREREVDHLSEVIKENNVNRYMNSLTEDLSIDNAVIINDLLTNLERIGDHAYNIVKYFTIPKEKDKFAGSM